MEHLKNKNILLIISGGIAAYKSLELIRLLKNDGASIQTILTKGGAQFITPLSVSALSGEKTYTDLWDLKDETEMGHIRLSRECDLIVIVPASADLMAKMAHGLADDLASTCLLASNKPIMAVPAMNPEMWNNPATQTNILILKGRHVLISGPEKGEMACGETGYGRLREPLDILADIQDFFKNSTSSKTLPLRGHKAIVTSGPTHEAIDPVRFIGNHSSGKQGHAIACALRDAGAYVTYISGPTHLAAPENVTTISITTADEMFRAVRDNLPADIAICAAAVADWKTAKPDDQKIKKQDDQEKLSLELERNIDILSFLGHLPKNKRPKMVIGFAAETDNLVENAQSKLRKKKADIILANAVNKEASVFGSDHNHVYAVSHSKIEEWPKAQKTEIAQKIVTLIEQHLNQTSNTHQAA